MGCITLASLGRHDGAYHDADEATGQDEEEAHICKGWQCAIGVHDDESRHPCVDEIHNEDMPTLVSVVWVEQTPHTDDLVCEDGSHGGSTEEPSKEVPPA